MDQSKTQTENINTNEIRNFLNRRLGEKEGDELMRYINTEIENQAAAKVNESKAEIKLWRDEMGRVFLSKDDATSLQQKLVNRVSKAEGTLILWGFVFWVTSLIAVLCFIKFFV